MEPKSQSQDLPAFLNDYLQSLSPSTRSGYAADLRLFFSYLKQTRGNLADTPIASFPLDILSSVSAGEISSYLTYLSRYERNGQVYTNEELGKARKLSSLRSMFRYCRQKGLVERDPSREVPMPKAGTEQHSPGIADKTAQTLLERSCDGAGLSPAQHRFHDKTRLRDTAILSLLSGTGIRVSECVALNMSDVFLEKEEIRVERKNGVTMLPIDRDIRSSLDKYLYVRRKANPLPGNEDALFLSLQNRRITVRAVEKLVQKYAALLGEQRVTPQSLRMNFGASLYSATGDAGLVAAALGNTDLAHEKKEMNKLKEKTAPKAFVKTKILPEKD